MINIKKMVKVVLFGASVFALFCGCGTSTSVDTTTYLNIVMMGAYTAPDDAEGNSEPRSLTYSFTGATATGATQAVELYDGDPIAAKIIGRSQIIYTKDTSELDVTSFTAIAVTFSTTVKGVGAGDDELSVTLDSGTVSLTEAFEIEAAQDLRLEIKANWKNTVNLDADTGVETLSAPSLTAAWVE